MTLPVGTELEYKLDNHHQMEALKTNFVPQTYTLKHLAISNW